MVSVLVELLVGVLNTGPADKIAGLLHSVALQTFQKIGPLHPTEFRAVVAGKPELAQKISAAIRADAVRQQTQQAQASAADAARQQSLDAAAAKPKIALSMNFGSFG